MPNFNQISLCTPMMCVQATLSSPPREYVSGAHLEQCKVNELKFTSMKTWLNIFLRISFFTYIHLLTTWNKYVAPLWAFSTPQTASTVGQTENCLIQSIVADHFVLPVQVSKSELRCKRYKRSKWKTSCSLNNHISSPKFVRIEQFGYRV